MRPELRSICCTILTTALTKLYVRNYKQWRLHVITYVMGNINNNAWLSVFALKFISVLTHVDKGNLCVTQRAMYYNRHMYVFKGDLIRNTMLKSLRFSAYQSHWPGAFVRRRTIHAATQKLRVNCLELPSDQLVTMIDFYHSSRNWIHNNKVDSSTTAVRIVVLIYCVIISKY